MEYIIKGIESQIRSWLQAKDKIDKRYHETILQFFSRSCEHTMCPDKAWFGVLKSAVSLTVGGIYLSALNLSSNDTGLWLLIDEELSVPCGRLLPVKSTSKSITPLTWLHLWPLKGLEDILDIADLWKSHSRASLKIFNSPRVSAERNVTHEKRGKKLLKELLSESSNIVFNPFPDEVDYSSSLKEGSVQKVLINAYERNPEARNRCLARFGCRCYICGFDFEKTYGEFGRGVIHVHHLTPISQVGKEYEIDPDNMRPVCPNCHTMIHRRSEPYEIIEIKQMIDNQKRIKVIN